jgi:hypothetical protein
VAAAGLIVAGLSAVGLAGLVTTIGVAAALSESDVAIELLPMGGVVVWLLLVGFAATCLLSWSSPRVSMEDAWCVFYEAVASSREASSAEAIEPSGEQISVGDARRVARATIGAGEAALRVAMLLRLTAETSPGAERRGKEAVSCGLSLASAMDGKQEREMLDGQASKQAIKSARQAADAVHTAADACAASRW